MDQIENTIRTAPKSTDATIVYVGEAFPGSATSAAVWKMKRITSASTDNAVVVFADGNQAYDNIWDDRETLTYS